MNSNLKYIENINIPKPLRLKKRPEFNINNISYNEKQSITLDYIIEDNGFSIYLDDYEKFQELPHRIQVISGGWYGENGSWSPLTRYVGKIICEKVLKTKKTSSSGKDYSFKVKKSLFSSYLTLTIESEKIGKVKIKCKSIIPQEYETFIFDKIENKWIYQSSFSLKEFINTNKNE